MVVNRCEEERVSRDDSYGENPWTWEWGSRHDCGPYVYRHRDCPSVSFAGRRRTGTLPIRPPVRALRCVRFIFSRSRLRSSQLPLSLSRDWRLPLRSWFPFFSSSTASRFLGFSSLCSVVSAMGNVSHPLRLYSHTHGHHADPSFLRLTGRKGSAETREECCEGGRHGKEPDQDQSGCHEHRLPDVQAGIRMFPPFTVYTGLPAPRLDADHSCTCVSNPSRSCMVATNWLRL